MSVYPSSFDTFREVEDYPGTVIEPDKKDTIYAKDTTDIQEAVVALQETLGLEPQGVYGDVATRIETIATSYEALVADIMALDSAMAMFKLPIGSIYTNAVDNTNPATLLGYGTWVGFGHGRVMVGVDTTQTEFDTAGETGGAKTVTLTESQMPSHTHGPGSNARFINYDNTVSQETVGEISGSGWNIAQTTGGTGSSTTTAARGGSGAHENMPPYITVWLWRRTA